MSLNIIQYRLMRQTTQEETLHSNNSSVLIRKYLDNIVNFIGIDHIFSFINNSISNLWRNRERK